MKNESEIAGDNNKCVEGTLDANFRNGRLQALLP